MNRIWLLALAAVCIAACQSVEQPVVPTASPTPRPDKPILVTTQSPSAGDTLAESDVRSFLVRHELAWQSGDVTTLATLYAPDATIVVNTGHQERTLAVPDYLKLAEQTRARLKDYRYQVDDSRITIAADTATVVENIAEEGRDGDRVIKSDTDAIYTLTRGGGDLRITRVEAKVLTATPGR